MPPKKKQKKADPRACSVDEALDRISRDDDELEHLAMCEDDRIFGEGFDLKTMQQLASALEKHPRTAARMLSVSFSSGMIGDRGLTAISGALGLCATLLSLALNDCNVGDEGLLALCKPLANCTALRQLVLSRGEKSSKTIGDKGFVQLATQVLPVCTALTVLNLGFQQIGNKGLSALAGVLRTCTGLRELQLHGNAFGDEGLASLAESLRVCSDIRYLSIGNSHRFNLRSPSWTVPLSQKGVLPVVEALLQVWSTPRAHLLKDEELRPFPLIANFVVRHLDLGEYPGRDLSKEREEEQRKLTVAIGLALKANPPARETDSRIDLPEHSLEREVKVITWPALKDCLSELGVPLKCSMNEYGWDGEGKQLCAWFRQTLNHSAELSEWVTMELGDKLSAEEVRTFVDKFPWHLGPRRVHNGA